MRPLLVGAGSVGLTLAARMGRAGHRPRIVTRRVEAAEVLRDRGVTAEDAATGESFRIDVEAWAWEELPDLPRDAPVLTCVRGSQIDEVTARLCERKVSEPVVAFINGIGHEERMAERLPLVVGAVWRETCTRVDDARVRFLSDRTGRIILGRHPEGDFPGAGALAELLRGADLDVGLSQTIGADKWLKLCVNVMSTPNALIRREDHATEAFVQVKVRLLEEARATLAAAGIEVASCDGRDRSLDDEIEFQRGALARGTSARSIALYNQVWTALSKGGPVEADSYHERIIGLAESHGVPTPTHRRTLAALLEAVRTDAGPESVAASALLPDP